MLFLDTSALLAMLGGNSATPTAFKLSLLQVRGTFLIFDMRKSMPYPAMLCCAVPIDLDLHLLK
jgi:hypothetical protein